MARWPGFAEIVLLAAALVPQLARASDTVVAPTAHADSLAVSSSATASASDSASSADNDQTLFLDVAVNGRFIGKIGEFTLRHGKLMARRDELRDLRFGFPCLAPLKPAV